LYTPTAYHHILQVILQLSMTLDFLVGCFGWKPSKMPKANEKTTQTWLYLLKILFIIPLGIAAFESRKVYNAVKGTPEVQRPPYSEHVLYAHMLTYIGVRDLLLIGWLYYLKMELSIGEYWKIKA
jgi:hypothetical protein